MLNQSIKPKRLEKDPKYVSKASWHRALGLSSRPQLLALEPRIVFDAAAAATADQAADQVAEQQAIDAESSDWASASDQTTEASEFAAAVHPEATRTEIAFVDGSIEGVDELIAGLDKGIEVILLDPERDGVAQIADILSDRSDIDALHILSHGSEGSLSLGNATLDADSMRTEYSDELTRIGGVLSANADILIYGCDYTSGEAGMAAASLLGSLTGADLAASIDATGSRELGGDYDLETSFGSVETNVAEFVNWNGVLADAAPTANDDTESTVEDGKVTFNPLSNDGDAEGDVFLTSFTQPTNGEVTLVFAETANVEVDSSGTTVNLSRNYENPVVFVFTTTENESSADPDIARVTNVTGNSFHLDIVEPNSGASADPTNGTHGTETVSYIVLEAGIWTLADGTVVEVGTRNVATGANSFTNVSFSHNFGGEPVVLSQVQTNNSSVAYNEARQRSVTANGYQVTNEPADFQSNAISSSESIGYLAIETGSGKWSGFDFEARISSDTVTHATSNISFTEDLGSNVNVLAQLHTFDGPDNAHIDARNVTGSGFSVSVQEDQTSDNDLNHTAERVGWLAISGSGFLGAASGTNIQMASADVQFIYQTGDDVHGSETFTYTIKDTAGQQDTATVTLNSTAIGDTVDDAVSALANTTSSFNVLSNDKFEGVVTLTGLSAPANGSVTFDGAGNVTYTPYANFTGTETLAYTVTEDTLGLVETGTVVITVTPNTPPDANDDTIAATEDAKTTFNPLNNDTDADGDIFLTSYDQPTSGNVELSVGETGHVDVTSNGTTINLTKSYTDPVVFVFTTTENESSNAADIARVTNITNNTFDIAIVEPNSGASADTTDGVHSTETVSYVVLEAGVWTLADGTVVEVGKQSVATNANNFTAVSFSNDFGGEPVVLSQVQTNKNGLDYIETRQRDVSATGYRVTNEPADYQSSSITKAETIGYLAIGAGSGTWNGLVFQAGITGDNVDHNDRSISFASNLGSDVNFIAQLHTFDGGDNSHADANSLTGSGVNVSVQEDRTLDSEINHTSERIGWLAIGGSGKLTATSGTGFKLASDHVEFTYTPDDDVHGTSSFNYTVEDTNSNKDTATASLIVAPEVDTATDNFTTPEETTLNANVLSNDTFEGSVTLTAVSTPANGTLSFDNAGNISYTPSLNFVGTETLTYTITEDHVGATETGTLVINVTPVNDDPVAKNDSASVDEDSSVSGDVTPGTSGQDSDIDGDTLTVSKINGLSFTPSSPILLPTGAKLTIASNGLFTYDTNAAFEALNLGDQTTDSFEYEISDGNGGTDKATVTITIDGRDENVAPIAVDNRSLDNASGFPVTVPVLANDRDSDGTLDKATIRIAGTSAPGEAFTVDEQGTWSVNSSSGSITFTPLPSFNGDPTPISYTVQDDDGAHSNAATVTVTFLPVISMASSEMLDAGIDTLQAVAALRNIDGSAGLTNDQIVLNTVAEISRLYRNTVNAFGSVFDSFDPELFAGHSMRFDVVDDSWSMANNENKIIIDTLARDRIVYVEMRHETTISVGDQEVVRWNVEQVDGTPLPSWVRQVSPGLLLLETPANAGELKLRFTAYYADGETQTRYIGLQTLTGEMRELAPLEQARGLTFQEQLKLASTP